MPPIGRTVSCLAALSALIATLIGCGDSVVFGPGDSAPGGSGGSGTGGGDVIRPIQRVDLLLTIDNSRSMAEKQQVLGLAVPALIRSLTNPPCVDDDGLPVEDQPAGPSDACPEGSVRRFNPVRDLHVGVISTSLGDHGGDVCPTMDPPIHNDDRGRLLDRAPGGGSVPTYDDLGFLAWDPAGELSPPGETSAQQLTDDLRAMVLGAGQQGCGYEAQLESWYRFLVDPDPYLTIEVEEGRAVLSGTDEQVLRQRRDFLRPDSLLVIMMLSDENDCSIRDGSQYFYAAKSQTGSSAYHLPKAQITCGADPNDPCCRSCGQSDEGCPPKGDECAEPHDGLSDSYNLRCWDQKRRFGIDFLWPVDRYLTGLTSSTVSDREGNVVSNPLYTNLVPDHFDANVRDPGMVVVASIGGVPWQDIARQTSSGVPDLVAGRDGAGRPVGGFQSAAELAANDVWSVILGEPSAYHTQSSARPRDPLMRESVEPRSGTHPITGDDLAPPGADTMANSINGHEYTIAERDDLQYACIFELPQPRDCTAPGVVACDCYDPTNDNPLCQNGEDQFGTTQFRAKAYPGIRQLQLLEQLGDGAVVGSICPAQLDEPGRPDFGYVPAVRALMESVAPHLGGP